MARHCDLNCPYTKKQRDAMCSSCLLGDAKDYIDSMSTVDAEIVRHGRWINISISANGNESSAECNLCGAIVHNNFSSIINYCPNCGAKMDKETANELRK